MNNYRYILDKSSKKFHCPSPSCGKRRFVRYIDTKTGQYLPEQYGRCDRENNCVHHVDPYTDGYAKAIWQQEHGQYNNDWKLQRPPRKTPPAVPTFYPIPFEVLKETQTEYERNVFIQNLLTRVAFPFEVQDIEKVIALYQLGTVPESGAVCFPFIDKDYRIRAIQEKIFDQENHTDKDQDYHTSWIHARLKYATYRNRSLPQWINDYEKNETKVSCLFGEHLLKRYPDNPIALVEAPKTAIYGTLYYGFPEVAENLLWMAVFNLSSLTYDKCKSLEGRDVFLFPDLSEDGKAFTLWSDKAKQIKKQIPDTYFKVSDLLESLAPELDRKEGNDLADYLIKLDWRKFRKQAPRDQTPPEPLSEITTNDTDAEPAILTSFVKEFGNHSPDKKRESDQICEVGTGTETSILTSNDKYQQDHSPIESETSVIPFSRPDNSPQQSETRTISKPISRTIEAYTNRLNELLIQNPMDANRFTVYPDIDSYNRRSVVPESKYKNSIDMSILTPVIIDPDKLMVMNDTHMNSII